MERDAIVSVLERISPALSTQDRIPIFQCFHFRGGKVEAFEDPVGMMGPAIEWPINGGVMGKYLLSFLQSSGAKDLEVIPGDQEVTVKAGRSRIRLPLIPPEDFAFTFPDWSEGQASFKPNDAFIAAIEDCNLSLGVNPNELWRLGITVHFGREEALFYSSNNVAISRKEIAMEVPKPIQGNAYILAPLFVDLLLKEKPNRICFHDKWVQAQFEGGVILYGRTTPGASPDKMEADIANAERAQYDIPKKLPEALQRAMIFGGITEYTDFSVKDDKLTLATRSFTGKITDFFSINHPPVKCSASPKFVSAPLKRCEKFTMTERYITFESDDGFLHVVATAAVGEEA